MPLLSALLFLAQKPWETYTLEGVTVSLPSPPQPVLVDGAPTGTHTWRATDGEDRVVTLTIMAYTDPAPGEMAVAQSLMGVVAASKGTIQSETDTVLNGWPGLDATLQVKDEGTFRYAAYVTGKTSINLMAGGHGDVAAFADRVFHSIGLPPLAGTGPLKAAGPAWVRFPVPRIGAGVDLPGRPKGEISQTDDALGVTYRTWSVAYGNRAYLVFASEIPEKERPKTPEATKAFLDKFNDSAFNAQVEKDVRRKAGTLGGETSQRTESDLHVPGGLTFLVESFVKRNQAIALAAMVPTALKDSAETRRFFGSFRFEPKPAPEKASPTP